MKILMDSIHSDVQFVEQISVQYFTVDRWPAKVKNLWSYTSTTPYVFMA